MKLSWKLFFITTPIFIIFLTVFGTWMVQDSFEKSYDREVQQCIVENQMFQNSYELTMNALSQEQRERLSVQQIVESFHRMDAGRNTSARILAQDGTVLYQDGGCVVEHRIIEKLDEKHNVGYEAVKSGSEVYIVVLGRSILSQYIETTKNITQIYRSREDMYERYQMGVLLMTVLVGAVILVVLFFVMRNMQKLSRATRQFARGKYDTRVDIRSGDEIGTLASDFNWMANAMNTQMVQLQNEVQRQEEFTAAFAHELKTPLTSIIGYADTIRQMELSAEETDMCADYIYRQGKRLQSLSYKLLEMTLAGQQEIVYREIYMPEFLEGVKKTVAQSLLEKKIVLYVEAQNGVIYGDRELLGSVFINLIDNARKASDAGKRIWVYGRSVPGGYTVTVEDEGRGVTQEELSRITEPFYMVDKSRARKEGGAGLGLALCRKIIDLHQGSWQFESEPGKGMRITVLFGLPDVTGRRRVRRRRPEKREKQIGKRHGRRADG